MLEPVENFALKYVVIQKKRPSSLLSRVLQTQMNQGADARRVVNTLLRGVGEDSIFSGRHHSRVAPVVLGDDPDLRPVGWASPFLERCAEIAGVHAQRVGDA